jgi:hypothetical protein
MPVQVLFRAPENQNKRDNTALFHTLFSYLFTHFILVGALVVSEA